MIIVRLMGGLGNQMFQYALGRKLSLSLSSELQTDISGFESYKLHNYSLHCFKLEDNTSHGLKPIIKEESWYSFIESYLPIRVQSGFKHIKEENFRFNGKVLNLTGDIYLEGYWQSEKYFKDIRDILLADFTIMRSPNMKNIALKSEIESCNSVSLHIRRGDYVKNAETLEKHGVCDLDYYYRAVAYVSEKISDPSFFIFSDDPVWAKENLQIDYPVTFISNNDASKNYEDLRLMSQCKHNIIANSSFSWWGAWLNDTPEKIVIAPVKWFNDKDVDTKDLIPETWISL